MRKIARHSTDEIRRMPDNSWFGGQEETKKQARGLLGLRFTTCVFLATCVLLSNTAAIAQKNAALKAIDPSMAEYDTPPPAPPAPSAAPPYPDASNPFGSGIQGRPLGVPKRTLANPNPPGAGDDNSAAGSGMPAAGPGIPAGAGQGWSPPLDNNVEERRVSRLEQMTFGSAYPEHEVEDRLDHLENEVFSKKNTGMPADQRLAHLESRLLGQQSAFGQSPAAYGAPPQQNPPPSPYVGTSPSQQTYNPVTQTQFNPLPLQQYSPSPYPGNQPAMGPQGMGPQMRQQGMPPQMGRQSMPLQMVQQGMPPQMGQQGMPPQMGRQGMAPQMGQQGMPPQMGQQGMPLQMGQQGMPPQMGQQGMPPQMGQQGMPPQMGQQGMPLQMGQQGMPPQMVSQGMPRQMGQQGMSLQMGQQGMSQQMGQQNIAMAQPSWQSSPQNWTGTPGTSQQTLPQNLPAYLMPPQQASPTLTKQPVAPQPNTQPAIPPVQPAIPPVQPAISPVQPAIPPVQPAISPVQTSISPVQTSIPPAQPAAANQPAVPGVEPQTTSMTGTSLPRNAVTPEVGLNATDRKNADIDNIIKSIPLKQGSGDYLANINKFSNGTFARWTTFPVLVHLPMGSPANWHKSLEEAVSAWGSYIPVRVASPSEAADIEIAWINHLPPRALGQTNLEVFNGRMRVTVYLLRPSYYLANTSERVLRKVAEHEVGHAIGIFGHSNDPRDLMYPMEQVNPKDSTKYGGITPRDLNTLRKIYEGPPLPPGFQSPHPMGWSLQSDL